MKRPLIFSLSVLFLTSFFSLTGYCQKSGVSKQNSPDRQLNQAAIDDRLIEIGKANGVNIIADASQFSDDAAATALGTQPVVKQGDIGLALKEFGDKHKLTWLKSDMKTVLWWTEPNVQEITRLILAGQSVKMLDNIAPDNDAANPTAPLPQKVPLRPEQNVIDREMERLLTPYFQQVYGWDAKTPGFSKDIKIADLPLDIRLKVMAKTQRNILGADTTSPWKAWFTDAFWSKTRLSILQQGPKAASVIVVRGVLDLGNGRQAGSAMGVASLDQPAR